jgi:hypothetical protein
MTFAISFKRMFTFKVFSQSPLLELSSSFVWGTISTIAPV